MVVLNLVGLASAQNLFQSDGSGNIYEYTLGGVRSTFASGLSVPYGLAFDGAGNLFVCNNRVNSIYEYTPGGVQSTFASGFNGPNALAFDSAGNLFEGDYGGSLNNGTIYEYTPGGVRSTFSPG